MDQDNELVLYENEVLSLMYKRYQKLSEVHFFSSLSALINLTVSTFHRIFTRKRKTNSISASYQIFMIVLNTMSSIIQASFNSKLCSLYMTL